MPRLLRRGLIAVAVLAALLAAWRHPDVLLGRLLLKTETVIVERQPDQAYEAVIPRYVELCATSQWRKKVSGGGNPFGHATLYLKGACVDETAPYPQLRRCHRVADTTEDSEHGAGISVGRWFKNVNWIGTPSHALFYAGDLPAGQRLTRQHLEATVRRAIDLGMFEGVELHPWTEGDNDDLVHFVAEESIATDFALQYARNLFCARLPVTAPQLDEIIAFLNDKNHEYATGAYDYHWNLLANNCVHTLRNAFASAHILPAMSVLQIKLRHVLDPATPANEFVNLARLAAEAPIFDARAVAREAPLDLALLDFGWLPSRPGAVVKALRMGATAAALRILSDPTFVDLETNIEHHLAAYDVAIAEAEAAAAGLANVRGNRWRRHDRALLHYLLSERAEASVMLDTLRAVKAGAAPPATAATR
jgi:hypothetical protein